LVSTLINIVYVLTCGALKYFRRKALPNTKTEDNAMAPAAKMGDSKIPNAGYNTPAAIGIKAIL